MHLRKQKPVDIPGGYSYPFRAQGLDKPDPKERGIMDETPRSCEISDEDLRAARKEMKGYVDITDDDLKRIYAIALRHAEQRVARRVSVRDVMTVDVIKISADAGINEATTLLSEHR